MSARPQPVFMLDEGAAARALSLKPVEFRRLVAMGIMPRPRDLGGFKRWVAEEIRVIATGEAAKPPESKFEV
ncbi:hypothetical protein [Mangrovicoccus ximenensis]|uniref:hypothetical protein n=1 Tax=Mangrovicoccus ximenensis TaxID=1911570 RepID=UPI001F31C5A5|nr:hypothetical protein [Mangrovicoccus ximenensis]